MASYKTIPNDWVDGVSGQRWKTPKLDADGEAISTPVMGPNAEGEEVEVSRNQVLVDATVRDILKGVVFDIPTHIGRNSDPHRIAQVFNALDEGDDSEDKDGAKVLGGPIKIRAKTYDWIFALLERSVPWPDANQRPLTAAKAKEAGLEKRSLARFKFGPHAFAILNQLRTPEDRLPVFDDDDEDDEE